MDAIQPAVAEITVSYINKVRAKDRQQITCSRDAFTVLLKGFDQNIIALQEQFVVAYLNRANKVLGLYRLATGGISGVVCDPRIILAVAIKVAASSIVMGHNHPSGNLKPSRADEEITNKIKEGSKLFDIKLLDHLIVSPCSSEYFSFADDGLI